MNLKSAAGAVVMAFSLLTMTNSQAETVAQDLQANVETVLAFYDLAINKKDFAAAEKYIGPHYIQHNPLAADGKAGLRDFVQYLRENLPDYHSDIKRHIAEGDYVTLHVHNKPTPDSRGRAVIDIFRLQNGKVVEHWDVIQEIPENPKNNNTMF